MISRSKFGMIALIAMMGIASPAFAATFETGTAANTYGWTSSEANDIGAGSSAPRLFDMVPQASVGSASHSITGGGNIGYNRNLVQDN